MPVFQAQMLIKVMMQDDSQQSLDDYMSHADPATILLEMDQGDLIGLTHYLGAHEVPENEVIPRLHEIGNDGSFFERLDDGDQTKEPTPSVDDLSDALTGRVLRAQIEAGIDSVGLQAVLMNFVQEAGLMEQFVAEFEDHVCDLKTTQTPTP